MKTVNSVLSNLTKNAQRPRFYPPKCIYTTRICDGSIHDDLAQTFTVIHEWLCRAQGKAAVLLTRKMSLGGNWEENDVERGKKRANEAKINK